MNRVVLSLGSNIGGGEELIQKVIEEILPLSTSANFSPIYTTKAYGNVVEPDYKNAVGVITTNFTPHKLNCEFKRIEKELGRQPKSQQCTDVAVDIDIVAYNSDILRPNEVDRDYITIGLEMLKEGF